MKPNSQLEELSALAGEPKWEEAGDISTAQRWDAVGRLVGGVAHEFNNLLTAILIYCDLLAEEAGGHSRLRHLTREIREAGGRGACLTQHLLRFTRPAEGEAAPHSVGSLVHTMRPLLQHLAGQQVHLRIQRKDETDRVRVDLGQLQQVLLNLVANARDAMPGGGKLLVETSRLQLREGDAQPAGLIEGNSEDGGEQLAPGSYVLLRVQDSGCGMTEATRRRIFEPFFTTKVGRGTGLGLAAVGEIVRRSGGGIAVESAPGRGTTVDLYWPAYEGRGLAAEGRAEPPPAPPPGAGETVLVAEEDDELRRSLRRALLQLGYRVRTARDGAAALREGERARRPIDVLLVCLGAPGLSSREVARRLRTRHRGLRVVYMCGAGNGSQAEAARPGTAVLRKPFPGVMLARALRQVLAAERSS